MKKVYCYICHEEIPDGWVRVIDLKTLKGERHTYC